MSTYGHVNVQTFKQPNMRRNSPANMYPVASAKSYARCTVIEGVAIDQNKLDNIIESTKAK